MVATTDPDLKLVMLQLTGLPVRASTLVTKVAMNCNKNMSAWHAPNLAPSLRLPDIHSAEMCKAGTALIGNRLVKCNKSKLGCWLLAHNAQDATVKLAAAV